MHQCLLFGLELFPLDFPFQCFGDLRVSVCEDIDKDVIWLFAEPEDLRRYPWNVMASERCVLHELKEACLSNLILIEHIKELENKLHMHFFFIVHKVLYGLVVNIYHDGHREIGVELGCQDHGDLVRNR